MPNAQYLSWSYWPKAEAVKCQFNCLFKVGVQYIYYLFVLTTSWINFKVEIGFMPSSNDLMNSENFFCLFLDMLIQDISPSRLLLIRSCLLSIYWTASWKTYPIAMSNILLQGYQRWFWLNVYCADLLYLHLFQIDIGNTILSKICPEGSLSGKNLYRYL